MIDAGSYDLASVTGTVTATVGRDARRHGDPFDALGDPNRRAIVELLRDGDRSVRELADALPISRPAVSRHLRLLKDAGLVADRAEGTRRLYRLHDEGVEAVRAYLEQVWGDAARASSWSPRTATWSRSSSSSRRLLARARVRRLDAPDVAWWPKGHSVVRRPRARGRVRAARRRADLRAHPGRDRARLGRGAGLGAAAPADLPVAPARPTAPTRPRSRSPSPATATATTVTIVHRGWERLGALGDEWRERNPRGWGCGCRTADADL